MYPGTESAVYPIHQMWQQSIIFHPTWAAATTSRWDFHRTWVSTKLQSLLLDGDLRDLCCTSYFSRWSRRVTMQSFFIRRLLRCLPFMGFRGPCAKFITNTQTSCTIQPHHSTKPIILFLFPITHTSVPFTESKTRRKIKNQEWKQGRQETIPPSVLLYGCCFFSKGPPRRKNASKPVPGIPHR
jgi:hypothetical protein